MLVIKVKVNSSTLQTPVEAYTAQLNGLHGQTGQLTFC